MQKTKKELSEEKVVYLKELKQRKSELTLEKQGVLEEIEKIQEYLNSLMINGKISASSKVFPGVRIFIKEAYLEIRNEFKATTFINEANIVKMTKYEELEEDLSRKK